MITRLTEYLLISLVLSLGFGQLLRFSMPFGTLYLHDVLVLVALVLNFRSWIGIVERRSWIGTILILVGLATGWVSALLHYPITHLLLPLMYTLRLLAYLSLYLVLRQSKTKISVSYFFLGVMIQWLIGIFQYFSLPDMRWAQYLGWDDHLSRLTLPHFDPTFSGIMLALGGLLAIDFKKYWLAGLLAPAVLLTYARSVWLSLLLSLTPRLKFSGVLIAAICLLLTAALLPKRFGEGTNLLRTFSITSRYQSDLLLVKNLRWDLVTGVGLNTFALQSVSVKGYPNHAAGPNDSYLYILATSGILGVVGWGIFLRDFYKNSHHQTSILFVIIASLFNNVLFYPFVMLWLFLIETVTDSRSR